MQRRLNPVAALRSDFKGDTFPDGRWSWRPPITSVSKPWRVTYRAQNRNATLVCVETRAVPSTPRRIQGEQKENGHPRSHPRPAADSVYESERPRGCCRLFLFEICDTSLAKIVAWYAHVAVTLRGHRERATCNRRNVLKAKMYRIFRIPFCSKMHAIASYIL